MTPSNTTRAFAIDRAATIAAIKRYEPALAHVLQAVEAFSDLPEVQALRAAREAHAAAQAEMEAADAALLGEIGRLRYVRAFPAVTYRGILYAPATIVPGPDTRARGSKEQIRRIAIGEDVVGLD